MPVSSQDLLRFCFTAPWTLYLSSVTHTHSHLIGSVHSITPACGTLPIISFHMLFLPESFSNLSSRPCRAWQRQQIPLITKIIEGRFEQAVTDRPRANANSDLLSVRHDVRSGTRSSAVHTSSLHGCLIRSVWAPHSHGNQSVKRDG